MTQKKLDFLFMDLYKYLCINPRSQMTKTELKTRTIRDIKYLAKLISRKKAENILRFGSFINPGSLFGIQKIFIGLTINSSKNISGEIFETTLDKICNIKGVVRGYAITGRYDFLIEFINIQEVGNFYHNIARSFNEINNIRELHSHIVLDQIGSEYNIPNKLNMKICGLVDYNLLSRINSRVVLSILGIKLNSIDVDNIVLEISKLPAVNWVCSVTGKYDLMLQTLSTRGIEGIRSFTNDIKMIDGIGLIDTFLVMSSRKKLVKFSDELAQKLKTGEELIL